MTPEKKSMFNRLLNILQRDLEEIRALASLLERKRDALLNVDEKSIRECTGELLARMETIRSMVKSPGRG